MDTPIVDFYCGERGNQNGTKLDEMMNYTLGQMEMDHDYIQWMFPSNERSRMNGDAPTLSKVEANWFQDTPDLQEKVKLSLIKFLDFLGLELKEENDQVLIADIIPTEDRSHPQLWMKSFNHNMLRVTRVLKCLRLVGLDKYALALFDALRRHRDKFSLNTFTHWTQAVKFELW